MGVIKDTNLLEVLYEQYQAVPVRGDDEKFVLRTFKSLPEEVAQLSIAFSMKSNSQPIQTMTGQVVATMGHSTWEYEFLNSAQGQLNILLERFLEKKRFKEFSKTFDKEVESELNKR